MNVLFVHGLRDFSLAEWCLRDAVERQGGGASFHAVELSSTDLDQQQRFCEHVALLRPEVVGFSCHAWSIDGYVEAARWVKALSPASAIVLGGPQVGSVPAATAVLERCAQVDYVIRGPGEVGLVRLLEALCGGCAWDAVPGLSFRKAARIGHVPAARHQDWTRGAIFHYENRLVARRLEGLRQAAYETTRGCSRRCAYCVYPGEGQGQLDEERVLEELEFILSFRIPHLRICDAHFGGTAERAKRLLRSIESFNRGTSLKIYPALEHVDEEYLDLCGAAGAEITSIGIQSTNERALRTVGRVPVPGQQGSIELLLSRFPDTPADLILGLPNDDLEGLLRSFEDVFRMGFRAVNAFRLTLFPGTPLGDARGDVRDGLSLFETGSGQVLSSPAFPQSTQRAVAILAQASQIAAPLVETRARLAEASEVGLLRRLAQGTQPESVLELGTLFGDARPAELLQALPAVVDKLRPAIGDSAVLRDAVVTDVLELLHRRCRQVRRRGLFWPRGRSADLVTMVVARLSAGDHLLWELGPAVLRRQSGEAPRGPHVLHLGPGAEVENERQRG